MKITFKSGWASGECTVNADWSDFFLWLIKTRDEKRTDSLLKLITEHDLEMNEAERANIRRTIVELLENKP